MPIRCTKPQLRLSIPWPAGAIRHRQLARNRVPDSDPGWIPAPACNTNHRRPNNDRRGSKERCRAGACPQPGEGWGAQTTPEPFHRPMHPIFMPWRAGGSRHERLVRKHVPDSDPGWMFAVTTVGLVMPASVGIPSHSSFRPPKSSFPRSKACPVPRYGAGIQRGGVGCGNDTRTLPPTNASNFHTLVCRRQPACAIAMKACPGLRSGIDRSSSLSLVIRDIPWSIRPLNSSFRRMPESRVREGET